MNIIEIDDIDDARGRDYLRLTDAQLRNRLHPEEARIIVESPKVIKVALESGLVPLSILCERKHIDGDAREVIQLAGDGISVITADRDLLASLTGYRLTRGVLCAMRRPEERGIECIPAPENDRIAMNEPEEGEESHTCGKLRVCILDGVCDSTNIGAIFRSAAALGIDAILLTRTCCDPFCRRAIRVSMGSVFLVPWGWIDSVEDVKRVGFKTVAMALRHDSISLEDARLKEESRLAIVMGTEGDGLAEDVITSTDYVVKIPMRHNVDSLNVAAASAIAFWELVGSR